MNNTISKSVNTLGIIPFFLLLIYFVNPYEKGFLIGYLLFAIAYFSPGFSVKQFDLTYYLLLIFSIVFASFYFLNMDQGPQWFMIYATVPHTLYLLGKQMNPLEKEPKTIAHVLILMGIVYSITAILSVGINLIQGGFVQAGRTIGDFWTGKPRNATGMGSFFVFNMTIPGLLIIARKKISFPIKILLLGVFFISILCVFRLGSRTQIVLTFISILGGVVMRIRNQSLSSNFKFILILTLLVFLGINYLSIDLDAEYLSSLGQRLQESDNTGSAGGRSERWAKSIDNLFKKPFGWSVNEFGYSHNMWFDVARSGTISSLLILLIFTVVSILNIIRLFKVNPQAVFLNSTCFIFNLVIFLQFTVEPVFDSPLFILFAFFCFVQGFINNYTNKIVEKYKNKKIV